MLRSLVCCSLACAAILFTDRAAQSQDAPRSTWPQWRGPTRDGQFVGPSWPASLQGDNLQLQWRVELGPGYPGPIVAEDRVFVAETVDQEREVVRAFDRNTGAELWRQEWPGALKVPFFAAANGDWIRATPAYDGETLYVAGIRDVLVALDAQTGDIRWRVDFVEQLGSELPAFGFVCSPLVFGAHVYVQAGGGFVKLDKQTGEVVWRVLDDGGGMNGSAFSSPVLTQLNDVEQFVVQTRNELAGVAPDSGHVLWRQEVPAFRGMNILTPTVYQGDIFTSAYGGRSFRYRVAQGPAGWSVEPAWTDEAQGYMSSPVVIGAHLYLHQRNQRLACLDLTTGERLWTSKPFGQYWSTISQSDRILALDSEGELFLVRANPAAFELLDSRKISEQPTWGHLGLADDQLFIRELQAIAVYRWTETGAPPAPPE